MIKYMQTSTQYPIQNSIVRKNLSVGMKDKKNGKDEKKRKKRRPDMKDGIEAEIKSKKDGLDHLHEKELIDIFI